MKPLAALISIWLTMAPDIQARKEAVVTDHARGTFDVKIIPQPADDPSAGPFSRLYLDKQFHGDLDATSKGQMLAAGTAVEGSAAYVALEVVTGTLAGRRGSFVLQHTGTMNKGEPSLRSAWCRTRGPTSSPAWRGRWPSSSRARSTRTTSSTRSAAGNGRRVRATASSGMRAARRTLGSDRGQTRA